MGIYLYNSEQIGRIERASLIAAGILDEIEKCIDVGISTWDIDRLAREMTREAGAQAAFLGYKGYPAAVCTSINEVVVHGIPDKKAVLKNGDIVGVDIGILFNGYFGDTARSFAVGTVDEEAERLLEVTRQSLYEGIARCTVGNRISDISHSIERYVSGFGFTPVREFIGHGVGRNLHEEPSIPNFGPPGKGPRIKNGMVFAIEPMINAGGHEVEVLGDDWTVVTRDRRLSAHFEHTVAVVDGRARILTRGKKFN